MLHWLFIAAPELYIYPHEIKLAFLMLVALWLFSHSALFLLVFFFFLFLKEQSTACPAWQVYFPGQLGYFIIIFLFFLLRSYKTYIYVSVRRREWLSFFVPLLSTVTHEQGVLRRVSARQMSWDLKRTMWFCTCRHREREREGFFFFLFCDLFNHMK